MQNSCFPKSKEHAFRQVLCCRAILTFAQKSSRVGIQCPRPSSFVLATQFRPPEKCTNIFLLPACERFCFICINMPNSAYTIKFLLCDFYVLAVRVLNLGALLFPCSLSAVFSSNCPLEAYVPTCIPVFKRNFKFYISMLLNFRGKGLEC